MRLITIDSVEWLTCSSDLVAIGKIVEIKIVRPPSEETAGYEECVVDVKETLKGAHLPRLRFGYHCDDTWERGWFMKNGHRDKPEVEWSRPGEEVLLFLKKSDSDDTDARATREQESQPEIRKALSWKPTSRHYSLVAVSFSNVTKYLYNKDLQRVTGKDELIALARTWSNSKVNYAISERVEDVFWGVSPPKLDLNVPAERKHWLAYLEWAVSDDPQIRERAALLLRHFPGSNSEEVLLSLLKDPFEDFGGYREHAGPRGEIAYPVRIAANDSLEKLGITVPDGIVLEKQGSGRITDWTGSPKPMRGTGPAPSEAWLPKAWRFIEDVGDAVVDGFR